MVLRRHMKILQTNEGILLKKWNKVYWLVPGEMYFTELPILSGKQVAKLNKKVQDVKES